MKKFKAAYSVSYKITDPDLFDELESNESSWVRFLTVVMDSVRFSEDFLKRWVSTEGDELYWDDDEDCGFAQVIVIVEDNYDGLEQLWNELLPELKETFDMNINTKAETFTLEDYATLVAKEGAFWNMVNWGTTIKVDEDSDGCLFEFDGEEYLGNIENQEDSLTLISGEFINSNGDKYELYDYVTTKEEVLETIEKVD
jgi:hypothetical protein